MHTKKKLKSSRHRRITSKKQTLTGVTMADTMAEIQRRITNAKIYHIEKIKFRHLPPMVCKDGFNVSIQAGPLYYSSPKNIKGPYTHVEMGNASKPIPSLKKWKKDNIWANVPLKAAAQVLNSHGGLHL